MIVFHVFSASMFPIPPELTCGEACRFANHPWNRPHIKVQLHAIPAGRWLCSQ